MASGDAAEIKSMLDLLSDQLGKESVLELVDIYVDNSAKQLVKLQGFFAANDLKSVNGEAHSLKSSSANMGAQGIAELSLKLEKATALDETAKSLLQTLAQDLTAAQECMLKWKIANA